MEQTVSVPRPEYPRPQFVRKEWMNLNGEWQFEIDNSRSGIARKLYLADKLAGSITVPFCPESRLSGVQNTDFMAAVWYLRKFTVPQSFRSKNVLLHIGACDYETTVWVNGVKAGSHRGGYTAFSFDVTRLLNPGENRITVCAEDDVRSHRQASGKQSSEYASHHCYYTRTTGIWQTVWLESVAECHVESLKYIPDPENSCLHIEGRMSGDSVGCELEVKSYFKGEYTGGECVSLAGKQANLTLRLTRTYLWNPGDPRLYDLKILLKKGGRVLDEAESYFGLRSVSLSGKAVAINGKKIFQRLVLDQGYYPDGIYTAPSDEELKMDIERSLAMGFNGARMHQKVFEPRYLYWADRLGYLVWGEYANWGLDITAPSGLESFLPEWVEAVSGEYNSPAVVGWCPFNETVPQQDDEVLRIVYRMTKALDGTRPVIDTSGYVHVETDLYDVHNYEQDPGKFAKLFSWGKDGETMFVNWPGREHYEGQPYFVSEYGGTWWDPDSGSTGAWGYGNRPKTMEEFLQRYESLTATLLNNPSVCAFCYTQLYDVEQEVNGLYTYGRRAKIDPEKIRRINTKPAAIESEP